MKDYAEYSLKCIKLLRQVNDAANKRNFVEAKNYAHELSMCAEQLDDSFDRHIVINEPSLGELNVK